jgi:hypothetical protein
MIAGNFKTYELTIANSGHGELDLSTVVTTEKLIKINPIGDGVRILITPSSSVAVADASDFLMEKDETSEFELGSGLDRLSIYNGSGGELKISIAVLF